MSVTVKQMIEEMPDLANVVMPLRTKVSKRAYISLVYHQRKVDEILNQYRGKEWAKLLKGLYEQAHELPEDTVGYAYRHKLL